MQRPIPFIAPEVFDDADAALQSDGTVLTLSVVTWTAPTSQAVLVGGKIEVQYVRADSVPATGDWTSWIEQGDALSAIVPGLQADWARATAAVKAAPGDGNALPTDMQVIGAVQRTAGKATASDALDAIDKKLPGVVDGQIGRAIRKVF